MRRKRAKKIAIAVCFALAAINLVFAALFKHYITSFTGALFAAAAAALITTS